MTMPFNHCLSDENSCSSLLVEIKLSKHLVPSLSVWTLIYNSNVAIKKPDT